MSREPQRAVVVKKTVQFNVFLPHAISSKFIEQLSAAFILSPSFSFSRQEMNSPGNSLILTTIPFLDIQDFYSFIRRFCDENDIILEIED